MRRVLALIITLAACDAAPLEAEHRAAPLEAEHRAALKTNTDPCGEELREIVEARAENLICHAECAELQRDCMSVPAPACHACEHEYAICRSTCPEPFPESP